MGRHFVTLSHNLSLTTAQNLLHGVHNLNNMATRVPTHVPALWSPSVTVGVLAFTYHACNLPLKTLALLGLGVSSGYLLVLDPNVLYTPHALSLIKPCIYTGFNTRILRAHLRGPLSRPDHRANLLHAGADVRSPEHEPSALVQYSYI